MESRRRHRYSRQIQKDLWDILQKDPRKYFAQSLVTLTDVEVSVDLSLARIYISTLPFEKTEEVLERLNDFKSEIRGKLGNTIGKQVRKIPELAFFPDNTEENANHMDRLIDSLEIPPAPEDDDE